MIFLFKKKQKEHECYGKEVAVTYYQGEQKPPVTYILLKCDCGQTWVECLNGTWTLEDLR